MAFKYCNNIFFFLITVEPAIGAASRPALHGVDSDRYLYNQWSCAHPSIQR